MADDKEVEKTIAEDLVVTKYKLAGQIVNRVLEQIIAKCVPDASAREICEFGDRMILEETSKVFKKEKDSKKGIAFSTCVSVNNCICHFSPIPSESDYILKAGDLAKIDLGAHIDGFIAVAAHTVAVGGGEVSGRAADVLLAAHLASEAALRLLRPGNENYQVTEVIQKISAEYGCKPVEGMLSHQLKQFRIDGEKSIIQNPSEAQRKEHEKATFETYEVYGMDVLVSTGEGVGREMDTRCTIYKKTDEVYQLKLKASRMFYSEVRNKHGNMPFNLRHFDKETSARLGVVECVNHKLIEPFQVLYERPGELVAQFKFTALLLPSGTHRITGLPFDKSTCKSERSIKDPELNSLLNSSAKANKKKKKKTGAEEPMEVETAA
ncbi:proliferation-associated protein 2G4 [Pectinophora gossypiella]|uniref:proliferation-associated protein 2G4 n=1 Tax=Pectinophora gossypiella TaxID=13191 RepID=UPI00214EC7FB|nr:proliferation-associated protein 2G4 [Pectinophora gossypiella]